MYTEISVTRVILWEIPGTEGSSGDDGAVSGSVGGPALAWLARRP